MDCSPPGSCPWDSSGKNIGVVSHFFIWTRTLVNSKNIYRKSRLTVYKQKIHRRGNQMDIWHFLGYLWGWAFQMLVVHLVSSSVAFSIFTLFWWKWLCLTATQETHFIPGSQRSPGEGIGYPLKYPLASLVAQMVKNLPAMQETWVWSLGWEDSPEEGMTTHSSILAWRIPIEEPGRLQPMGLQRHDWVTRHSIAHSLLTMLW